MGHPAYMRLLAASVALLAAACSTSESDPGRTLTPDQQRSALLTAADLPDGWAAGPDAPLPSSSPTVADGKVCEAGLAGLSRTFPRAITRGFHDSTGLRFAVEVLSSFAGTAEAQRAENSVRAKLKDCAGFIPGPRAMKFGVSTESFVTPPLGDSSAGFVINQRAGERINLRTYIVVFRVDRTLVLIDVIDGPTSTAKQVEQMANKALARVKRVA